MATSLPLEFSKFNKNCRYLKRILNGTFSAIQDVVKSGKFYEEQITSCGFHLDQLMEINDSLHNKSPCILVCGQNRYAKAVVINELFNQPILPVITEWDRNHKWRIVRFQYGIYSEISLSLPNSYELVEHLQVSEKSWCTVPETDLEIHEEAQKDPAQNNAVLEIRLRHPLLKDDVQVVMAPCKNGCMDQLVTECLESSLPILIYAIGSNSLSEKEIEDLVHLKQLLPKRPVFFIRTRPPPSPDLTESEQHAQMTSCLSSSPIQPTEISQNSFNIFQQLCDIGYMSMLPSTTPKVRRRSIPMEVENELVENFDNMSSILLFVRHILQAYLVNISSVLHEYHNKCLGMFIVSAFDMARDMMITPKRLVYARDKESELFNTLLGIANRKQDEIRDLITATITNMKEELMEKAMNYEFQGVVVPENGEVSTARDLKICTGEIQDLILGTLNNAVANKLIGSVEYLRESFIGTLERCLESLENAYRDEGESLQARAALTQILNAAYQVEVTTKTSSSFMRCLWEKMKQVIHSMPWKTPPRIDAEWKRRVAADMINSLSESRLARSICSQFRDKLRQSHESFSASLRQLEAHHSGRLEKTEEERLKVRKCLAPRIARYALESTCLRDMLLYGMPQLGREIGRGQYGVVYACDSWGGCSPCAVKSVVPPDEKHWNDLAMEFFYTRNVPEHDRVVALRGAVIDVSYGGGTSPAVLLIMDRLQRDLNSALKTGLDWLTRLQIAIDVVQGIRFLHSQGLIHRDIKLKNVLLDKKNRAKITDLGFCKPEAMMSGSIVGTPIHMAPELFSGKYDSTVDVYAFGILFWNVCAGHVRMPYIYEQCQNKDHLWTAVKKGARPEKLPQFDEECWCIMQECWSGDSSSRPLLGNVEQSLVSILERYRLCPPKSLDVYQTEYHAGSLSTSPYIDVELSPT